MLEVLVELEVVAVEAVVVAVTVRSFDSVVGGSVLELVKVDTVLVFVSVTPSVGDEATSVLLAVDFIVLSGVVITAGDSVGGEVDDCGSMVVSLGVVCTVDGEDDMGAEAHEVLVKQLTKSSSVASLQSTVRSHNLLSGIHLPFPHLNS